MREVEDGRAIVPAAQVRSAPACRTTAMPGRCKQRGGSQTHGSRRRGASVADAGGVRRRGWGVSSVGGGKGARPNGRGERGLSWLEDASLPATDQPKESRPRRPAVSCGREAARSASVLTAAGHEEGEPRTRRRRTGTGAPACASSTTRPTSRPPPGVPRDDRPGARGLRVPMPMTAREGARSGVGGGQP